MRALVTVFFLLLMPGLCPAADRLVVTEALCVQGPVMTLGQLVRAEGKGAEAFLAARGAEPLLAAPKFDGARATLNGPRLLDLMLSRLGPGVPQITMPDRVQVQRGGQVVAANALLGDIDKILTRLLDPLGGEVTIRDHRLADYLFLETMEPVHFRVEPVGQVGPGRISLRLEALNESGRVVQAFTGTVFADVWKTVPCAARVMNRGDRLEPAMVDFRRKNLAHLPRPAWDGQGGALRARQSVGVGQVITADAVEPIPAVVKGQIITLIYSGRSLRLSVPAECLEDGGIGSTIRVRNVQSHRTVVAQVQDSETARVP